MGESLRITVLRALFGAGVIACVGLTFSSREAEGRPTSPRASRQRASAMVGRLPRVAEAHSMEPRKASEMPACAPEHPFVTPFDGKLALRSAYRTAKPKVFQFCPQWSNFGQARGRGHGGIDISQPTGTPVRAAVAGELSYARDPGGYGLFARIRFRHPRRAKDASCSLSEEVEIIYGHIQEEFPKGLPQTRQVKPGEIVGHVGCTGNAKGMCSPSPESHLHVTVERAGDAHAKMDPISFLGWAVAIPTNEEKPADFISCGK